VPGRVTRLHDREPEVAAGQNAQHAGKKLRISGQWTFPIHAEWVAAL
jgi:hypothetical protein